MQLSLTSLRNAEIVMWYSRIACADETFSPRSRIHRCEVGCGRNVARAASEPRARSTGMHGTQAQRRQRRQPRLACFDPRTATLTRCASHTLNIIKLQQPIAV
ncbi:hypothetical protein ACJJTC_005866 [Scirpophaga incertulas]